MKITTLLLIPGLAFFVLAMPPAAAAKDKKKHSDRGMLESMEAIPCGAKQRGLTGLGSVFGSVGVEHVNSDEKLCPQYLLRTDEMEYEIRPIDNKHPVILPVGHEGEFKIKKDQMQLKVPDGDRKTRAYHVVGVKPLRSERKTEASERDIAGKTQDKEAKKDLDKSADPPN
jgi:hypothetical protein